MKFLMSIVLSAVLAGPVLANEPPFYSTLYNATVVTEPNQRWIFKRVLVSSAEDGTRVSGRLTAVRRAGLSKGHVDVTAFSPEGMLVAEVAAGYSPSVLSRKMKRKGGVHFSVDIPQQLPPHSMIKLSFHENGAGSSSVPLHPVNTSR